MNAREIIAALGGRDAVARATGADPNTVLYWEKRDRIPVERWPGLITLAAETPDCSVTLETLSGHVRPRRSKVAA